MFIISAVMAGWLAVSSSNSSGSSLNWSSAAQSCTRSSAGRQGCPHDGRGEPPCGTKAYHCTFRCSPSRQDEKNVALTLHAWPRRAGDTPLLPETEALALAVHEAVQKQHGRAANVARADPTSIQPIQPSNLGAKRSFELCILCLTRHRCED